jgi:membrane protease subunit (stomatin/prohibitin family)
MAFFDKLNDFAKTVGDKAGEAIETTKLNSKINAEKSAIEVVLKKIGEYYYQKYQSGESLPEETAALCGEIDGHNAAINEAKAEIERIKAENAAANTPAPSSAPAAVGGIVCPACGKDNAPGTKFCQECGGKLEAARVCSCGAEVAPGVRFCGECGAKFE